jgi:predicted metalloprotease
MAYDELARMWGDDFDRLGTRFETPGLVRYRAGVRTGCGVMGSDNAAYCPADNAIYFDELFVAAQAKRAGRQLGTDGDMAAVGVIAHEMGHAVAMQLGHASRYTYRNESTADCLAGAFARRAGEAGQLEKGDVDEAFYAMFTAGDPSPRLTGDPRVDRRIMVRASLMGHGTYEQRMNNFRTGLESGAKACLAEFERIA